MNAEEELRVREILLEELSELEFRCQCMACRLLGSWKVLLFTFLAAAAIGGYANQMLYTYVSNPKNCPTFDPLTPTFGSTCYWLRSAIFVRYMVEIDLALVVCWSIIVWFVASWFTRPKMEEIKEDMEEVVHGLVESSPRLQRLKAKRDEAKQA